MSQTEAARVVACPACTTKNRVPADANGHPRCARCHVDLPWLVDVGPTEFERVVEQSAVPVLLDCWAAWCGPCRTVAPIIEQLAVDYAGRVKVVKLDVDRAPHVSGRLGIQGIPAFFIYDDGAIVDRLVGAQPEAVFRSRLDAVVGARS